MKKILVIILAMLILLAACSPEEVTEEASPESVIPTETQAPATGYPVGTEMQDPGEGYPVETETMPEGTAYPVETEPEAAGIRETASQVINALAEKDMASVASFVHPERGLRFSPYGFVTEEHLVFMPDELPGLPDSEEVYTWGAYDGTGDPIELTFDAYYQEFVYSADFANPEEIALNERIGEGNTINNISEFYPGASFIEYHFSGFEEEYEGMDWESLRLVFVQEDGAWWLVGVVHDEWTI